MKFIEPFVAAAREYWRELLVALAVVLAVAVFLGRPIDARADAPACMTPDAAVAEIAKANAGVKPAAILEGDRAAAFAKAAGRQGGHPLVYLLYIHEGSVFIFEFERSGGKTCFRTQGAMPLEQFRLMFPGVLPEDK